MDCNLKAGDIIDAGVVYKIDDEGTHRHLVTRDLLSGKRAVVFGGPAPFSRLDTEQAHEYARLADEMLKHVDAVIGVYCQDAFVMKQFDLHIRQTYPGHHVAFWGDGDALFARGNGLDHNFSYQGLSLRSGRFAMVVDDQVLEHIFLDDYKEINLTSAEAVLQWLKDSK